MVTTQYPAIGHGRVAKEGVRQDNYDLIYASPDISGSTRDIFLYRLTKCIQWTGDGCDHYPDSFLIWRLDDVCFWVVKLSDGGNDSFSRPHWTRMDAILWKGNPSESLEIWAKHLAKILVPVAWREIQDNKRIIDEGVEGDKETYAQILNFLQTYKEPNVSLLISNHPYVDVRNVSVVFKNYSHQESFVSHQTFAPVIQQSPMSVPSSPVSNTSEIKRRTSKRSGWLILGLLMESLLLVFLYQRISTLQIQRKNQQSELVKVQAEIEHHKKKIKECNESISAKDLELQKNITIISNKEKEFQMRCLDIQRLKTEVEDLKRNANDTLCENNRKLKEENDRYRALLSKIKELLKEQESCIQLQ